MPRSREYVTIKALVEDMFDRAVQEFSTLDVAVHNAGIITIAKIDELMEEEWDRVLAVNAKGVFLCCQAAAKYMMKRVTVR
jgi:meso-butanediol dehydrogenase/(S,S)-butanediol dehydrogenase/diacetyl reductase